MGIGENNSVATPNAILFSNANGTDKKRTMQKRGCNFHHNICIFLMKTKKCHSHRILWSEHLKLFFI